MALIVEDGTMPEGANTYASVSEADTYLLSRGVSDWPAPPSSDLEPDPQLSAKEAALIRSADYLNGLKWKGEKLSTIGLWRGPAPEYLPESRTFTA